MSAQIGGMWVQVDHLGSWVEDDVRGFRLGVAKALPRTHLVFEFVRKPDDATEGGGLFLN